MRNNNTLRLVILGALVSLNTACGKDSSPSGDDGSVDAGADISFPDIIGGDDTNPGSDASLPDDVVVVSTCSEEDSFSPNHTTDEAALAERLGLDREDLHLCPGYDDFFLITLGPGEGFLARIEFAHRIGDLDLWLFPLGTTDEQDALASGATEEDVEEIRFVSDGGGRYVLMIDGFRDQGGYYDLLIRPTCRVDADCPCYVASDDCEVVLQCVLRGRYCDEVTEPICGSDAFEPNNNVADASDLGLGDNNQTTLSGTVCVGDWDFFSLPLAAVSNVAIELEFDPADDLDVAVINANGDVAGYAGHGTNPEELSMPRLSGGGFFIYVDSPAGGTNELGYTLRVAVEDAEGCETDADCNYAPGRSICSDDGGCISYTPEEPNPVGGQCDSDDDCDGSSWGCYQGGPGIEDNVCTLRCRNDSECAVADGGQCLAIMGRWGGLCFGACETDANCPVPYWCDTNTGECAHGECGTDDDCEEGQACLRSDDGTAYCRTYDEGACPDLAADGNGRISDATPFPLDPGSLADLTICNGDDDWYTFDITEEPALAELSVTFDGDADLDIHLMDADGHTVGRGNTPTGNPEVLQADLLGTGTYYVFVTQLTDPTNPVTTYTLQATVSAVDGCTADGGECLDLSPFRIDCLETGVCAFLEGNGEIELGELCDSDDDCVDDAELCLTYEQIVEPGDNICTRSCGRGDNCDDIDGVSCAMFGGGGNGFCMPD